MDVDYWNDQERLAFARLDYIITGDECFKNTIESITNYMTSLIDPLNFDSDDPENVISAIDKNYINACMSMKKSGISDPKELTVFEWEIVIDNFEEELINKHKNDTL